MNRQRNQRGSTLMLMPAAVLVLIILAAITVDAAVAYLGERELANATAAAANDAAGQALDEPWFRRTGEVRIDPELAERVVASSISARGADYLQQLEWDIQVPSPNRVVVRARAAVRTIFARAVPGGPDQTAVDATSQARAIER